MGGGDRNNPVDWKALLDGYRWSGLAAHRCAELMQAYPEAKVILTVRDPGAGARHRQTPSRGSQVPHTSPVGLPY